MKKPKLIYVKWEDPCSFRTFQGPQEEAVEWSKAHRFLIEQISWLLDETDTHILVAEDRISSKETEELEYRNLTKIMKSLIRKRKVVKI